jgi:hypothetical protein
MTSRLALSNQYLDIKRVLDAALHSGGTYTADTKGKAVYFRHRAYTFMKKFREAEDAPSVYDTLVLKKISDEEPTKVRIEVRQVSGTFVADNPQAEEIVDQETLDAALQVRKNLGLL